MKSVTRRGFLGLGAGVLGGVGILSRVKAETDFTPGEAFTTTDTKVSSFEGLTYSPGVPVAPKGPWLRIYRKNTYGQMLYVASCPDAKLSETMLGIVDDHGAGTYVVVSPDGRIHSETVRRPVFASGRVAGHSVERGVPHQMSRDQLYDFVNRTIRYRHSTPEEHEKLRQQFLDTYPELRKFHERVKERS